MIDLHTHSVFSDGTWTPRQIVSYADDIGLQAIALTDHDTIDGIPSFLQQNSKVLKVPGVEISIDYDKGTFHLLGLFISCEDIYLINAMEELKNYRRSRNSLLIDKISELIGENVSENDIAEINKGELGRPHMAKFLVKKNIVGSVNEAFEKYLGKGKPLYLPKRRFGFEKAVDIIKKAGGLCILAHPDTLNLNIYELNNFIKVLKEKGLDGMEVYYSSYNKEDVLYYKGIAEKNNLLISAGSDFHGDNKENLSIAQFKYEPDNPEKIISDMSNSIKK